MFEPLSERGKASRTGRAGEYLAAYFFERKGFTTTLASAVGFDLVVAKQSQVYLIEVKARSTMRKDRLNQMRFKLRPASTEAYAYCFVNLLNQRMLFEKTDDIRHIAHNSISTSKFTEQNMHDSFERVFHGA